jgi:hypothetical protein
MLSVPVTSLDQSSVSESPHSVVVSRSLQWKARDAKRLQDMDSLVKALKLALDEGEMTLVEGKGDSGMGSQAVDSTGWVKYNIPSGKTGLSKYIPTLPIDPLNTDPNFYYFASNGSNFELNTILEGPDNVTKMSMDGGTDPSRYEVGTDLNLISQ